VFRSRNLLWGGLVIFLLTALAGGASVVLRAWSARATMMIGCVALVAGAAITFTAIAMTSAGAFLAGIAIAGIGVGSAFLGSFRVLSALATPGQRARLISAIFIVAYTAFSLPVVVAGIATTIVGLHGTGLAYCAAVAALAASALASLLLQRRATRDRARALTVAIDGADSPVSQRVRELAAEEPPFPSRSAENESEIPGSVGSISENIGRTRKAPTNGTTHPLRRKKRRVPARRVTHEKGSR
jgi:MFS family permease